MLDLRLSLQPGDFVCQGEPLIFHWCFLPYRGLTLNHLLLNSGGYLLLRCTCWSTALQTGSNIQLARVEYYQGLTNPLLEFRLSFRKRLWPLVSYRSLGSWELNLVSAKMFISELECLYTSLGCVYEQAEAESLTTKMLLTKGNFHCQ